jgi:hypothetical protein
VEGREQYGSSLAVQARTAGRIVSHLALFVLPGRNVSNNCVIMILFHEKRCNKYKVIASMVMKRLAVRRQKTNDERKLS